MDDKVKIIGIFAPTFWGQVGLQCVEDDSLRKSNAVVGKLAEKYTKFKIITPLFYDCRTLFPVTWIVMICRVW